MLYIEPGAYKVVTGRRLTAEQASAGLFPDHASVVLVDTEYVGRTVAYTFLVDYPEPDDEAVQPPA